MRNAYVLSRGEGDGIRVRACLLMGGLQTRMWQRDVQDASVLQPCSASAVDVLEFFCLGLVLQCILYMTYTIVNVT
jgi:hypothetical protein